ncbi:hypothetical protein [Algoriphagus resistens]|uniref:hypothetical protein n=1 Tax=Algoriphagus resistens TaxID=1750590 RepID=UPI0007168E00|nr:hypothetical protein [Algoriphagus resistens]
MMEELTEQEIINNCLEYGEMTVLEFDVIPNANRTRITKSRYSWNGHIVENTIGYVNTVTSNSVYAILSDVKEVIYE